MRPSRPFYYELLIVDHFSENVVVSQLKFKNDRFERYEGYGDVNILVNNTNLSTYYIICKNTTIIKTARFNNTCNLNFHYFCITFF